MIEKLKHQPNTGKQPQTLTEKMETHTNINQKFGKHTHYIYIYIYININRKGGKPIKHETKSSKYTHKH